MKPANAEWLLAIDPGKRHCGVAIFRHGRLINAATVHTTQTDPMGLARRVWDWYVNVRVPYGSDGTVAVVVENPQSYRTDAIDEHLESLRNTITAIEELISPLRPHKLRPFTWKGNVPKPIHHARLARILGPEASVILGQPPQIFHDTWDAVGLGLYALGRTGRGGRAAPGQEQ